MLATFCKQSAMLMILMIFLSSKALSAEIPTLTGNLLDEIIADVKENAESPPVKDRFMTDDEYQALLAAFYSKDDEPYGTYKLEYKPDICVAAFGDRRLCYFVEGENFVFDAPLKRFLSDSNATTSERQTLLQSNLGTSTTVYENVGYYSQVVALQRPPKIYFSQDRDTVKANFDNYIIHVVFDLKPEHQFSDLDWNTGYFTEATLSNPYERKELVRTVVADVKYYALYLDGAEVFNSSDVTPETEIQIIDYPKKAIEKGWVGYVNANFSVSEKGRVTDVEIPRYSNKCWFVSKYFLDRYKENPDRYKGTLGDSRYFRDMLLEGRGYTTDGFDSVMRDTTFREAPGRCKLFVKSAKKTLKELRFKPGFAGSDIYVTLYYIDAIAATPTHVQWSVRSVKK